MTEEVEACAINADLMSQLTDASQYKEILTFENRGLHEKRCVQEMSVVISSSRKRKEREREREREREKYVELITCKIRSKHCASFFLCCFTEALEYLFVSMDIFINNMNFLIIM